MIGKGTFAVFFKNVRNPGWVKYAKEFEFSLRPLIFSYVEFVEWIALIGYNCCNA